MFLKMQKKNDKNERHCNFFNSSAGFVVSAQLPIFL